MGLFARASPYNPSGSSDTQLPNGVARIATPYGETVFEASPLNRVLEQGAPGDAWQPSYTRGTSGRTVVQGRAANNWAAFSDPSSRKVALYGVTLSASGEATLTLSGSYVTGQLLVGISKDENWTEADGRNGTVEEYTDRQGQVVLKRTFNKNGSADEMLSTYYVYDDFGNLCFVLPPGMDPDREVLPTSSELDEFGYRYRYDGRNRMVEKKLPGKGTEYFVYNKLDRLVASQDANQRLINQWSISKYDGLGRLVVSGLWSTGSALSRETVQAQVNTQVGNAVWEERISTDYTNRSWPTTSVDIQHVNYFDDYSINGIPHNQSGGYTQYTHGLPTASKTKVIGTTNFLWTVSYYDDKGRAVRPYSQHYKGGTVDAYHYDDTENVYDFSGVVRQSTRKHYAGGSTPEVTVKTEYTYDHQLRLIDTWKTVNTGTRTLITRNEYNDIGQLVEKKLHSTNGSSFAQTLGYSYNARGWLSGTGSPLFSQTLKFNEGTDPQYNGNISSQEWKHGTGALQSYGYTYDKVNRLLKGEMPGGLGRETLSYDKGGNILSLERTGTSSTLVDQLSYSYTGNRLTSVSDAIAGGASDAYQIGGSTAYTYDANGNMKSRANSSTANNISSIVYNHLGLAESIAATAGTTTYTYDASGRKLRTVFGSTATDYIDGIEYEGGTLNFIHMEEGRIVKSGSSYSYEYFLRDHLGNTRSGFRGDNPSVASIKSDYYPFGLQYQSGIVAGSLNNKYLYNGKELQDGTKLYDYGARLYDPLVGRWGAVDPMADMYSSYSLYAYVGNDPILFHDPNGMYRVDANGNITIDDADEIFSFFNYLNNSSGASINDMSNHIIGAGNGFSWELDAVTVTGRSSFESGGWLSDAQGRVSDAVGLIGNINSISAGQFNFEHPSGNMGGLLGSGVGATLSVGSHLMYNKESWYSLQQMKSYSHRFHGNQYTGGRLAHGRAFSRRLTGAGYGLGIYNAYSVEQQYSSGQISGSQRWMEQSSNVISTFGGIYGAAWSIGWETGRSITNIPGYHKNVRVPLRRFLGIRQ